MRKIIVQRHGQCNLVGLTVNGKEEVQTKTRNRLENIVSGTRFLIVYSNTGVWDTARIIDDEISSANSGFKVEGCHSDCRLSEAQFLGTPYESFLNEKYNGYGKGFWDAYNTDRHKNKRIRWGAEGPQSIAGRMLSVIDDFKDYLSTGDNLVVWAVTNGECIDAYLRWHLKMTDIPLIEYNGGFCIDDGVLKILE